MTFSFETVLDFLFNLVIEQPALAIVFVLVMLFLMYLVPCIFRIDIPSMHFYRHEKSGFCGDIEVSTYRCRLCGNVKHDH
ncbi:hypothetical protein EJ350_24485 [Vibrio parahaemolyticus]|nr:hypothetical protein [Vibrio parahaemolyticus]